MKLRNKKTGEIKQIHDGSITISLTDKNNPDEPDFMRYKSLKELNSEWEDAPEEPKEYWFIGEDGNPHTVPSEHYIFIERLKEIGNYFETKEEAEKTVDKLRAWKQLKDKGFKFSGWEIDQKKHLGVITIKTEPYYSFEFEDLDLLFSKGGEE